MAVPMSAHQIEEAIDALDPEHMCAEYWEGKDDRAAAAEGLPPPTRPNRPAAGEGSGPRRSRAKRSRCASASLCLRWQGCGGSDHCRSYVAQPTAELVTAVVVYYCCSCALATCSLQVSMQSCLVSDAIEPYMSGMN